MSDPDQIIYRLPTRGPMDAPVVVLCDAPLQSAWERGRPMDSGKLNFIGHRLHAAGFAKGDVIMVAICPPIPKEIQKNARRKWLHVEPYQNQVLDIVEKVNPKVVVTLGELATRIMTNRAVKITKARGQPIIVPGMPVIFPMLSPGFVQRIPEHDTTFTADCGYLGKLKRAAYEISDIEMETPDYQWCTDIGFMLGESRPRCLAVDCETTGLIWHDPDTTVLTVSLTPRPGVSYVCPLDTDYYPDLSLRQRARLRAQLAELLGDPTVRKMGHNLKFDHLMLRDIGIEVKGWLHDTLLMAFCVDENLLSKSLDDCTRIFVPEMAGYADLFNATFDKGNMRSVPLDDMLTYAGGDTDATYRLALALEPLLKADRLQHRVYRRVQMPTLLTFAHTIERYGKLLDRAELERFEGEVDAWVKAEYAELIQLVPYAVRASHADMGKELSFARHDFVRDVLFTGDGFGLVPKVWTKTTEDLEDITQRVPSVSAKDHFPYFVTRKRKIAGTDQTVGDFVSRLSQYQKTKKLQGTYIGLASENSGFYRYIAEDGRIYPSYHLHKTNTGRTASDWPNDQNYPKRSMWAKKYARIFLPTPGYRRVTADLSQIELRIAAWMAGEETMLRIYANDGDIHASTAAACLRFTMGQFDALPVDDRKLQRFRAKAVNFGYIYGAGWRTFQTYAKTDFDTDYSDAEARENRSIFFQTYPGLISWHEYMRGYAKQHGIIRSLHGATRHLPSIYSADNGIASQAERQAVNAPVQRFGSDLGLIAFTRISAQLAASGLADRFRVIGFIHDQIVMECEEGYEEAGASYLKWCMETPPLQDWFDLEQGIPIKSDVEIERELHEFEEVKDHPAIKPEWWDDREIATINQLVIGA